MQQLPLGCSDPYRSELLPLDEQLCKIVAERLRLGGDHPGVPEMQQIEEWARRLQVEAEWLHRLFTMLGSRYRFEAPIVPSHLRTVIPILKTAADGVFQFTLTHMMQYENASVLCLDVQLNDSDPLTVLGLRPGVLEILPRNTYKVRHSGSHGAGKTGKQEFIVTPALPDDLKRIQFSLHPSIEGNRRQPKQVYVEQTVDFR